MAINELLFAVIAGATFSYMLSAFSRRWPKLNKYPDEIISHWLLMVFGIVSVILVAFFGNFVVNNLRETKLIYTFAVIILAIVPYTITHFVGIMLWWKDTGRFNQYDCVFTILYILAVAISLELKNFEL